MNYPIILIILFIINNSLCEDAYEAADHAKWIMMHEKVATIATTSDSQTFPFVMTWEYCDHWAMPGTPYFLIKNTTGTFQNVLSRNIVGMSVTCTNCSIGGIAVPRLTLMGRLIQYTFNSTRDTEHFLTCHPNSRYWGPDYEFWQFTWSVLYYFGGHKTNSYVGGIGISMYNNASPKRPFVAY